MFNIGLFLTSTSAIVFGLLDSVSGHYPFLISSLIVRSIEALGNAAFLTSSFTITATEFPETVATTFASLETFFGFGLIVGPLVSLNFTSLKKIGHFELKVGHKINDK